MDIGEIECEARVPRAPALRVLAGEVGDIADGGAKTGWADHGTVAAGQAAGRYLMPARVLQVAIEQLFDVGCVQAPPHLRRRSGDDTFRGGKMFRLRLAVRDVAQDGSPPCAPYF